MTRNEFGLLLDLEVDLIPEGKHNRPGTVVSPTSVTIHNTSNTASGADAHAHARYLKEKGYYDYNGRRIWTSWHYTVDDKRIVKHLPLDEEGYHAHSQANGSSIGIEICMNAGIDRVGADLRAARLVATLLYDFRFSANAIKTHYDWTRKACPELLLNGGIPGGKWNTFKALVMSEFNRIDPSQGDSVPQMRTPTLPPGALEADDSAAEDHEHFGIPPEFLSTE